MTINTYKDLTVWQKAITLVEMIYKLTSKFPQSELFGLTSQIKRAAVSIPSNIAEGYGRKSHREYLQFYSIAYGSALEVETQLYIAKRLNFVPEDLYVEANNTLTEIIKMLYVMVYKRN